jgi:preprotein translocase subunit SecA
MEILERIWEFLGGFFSSILRGFERSLTSIVGSSNERLIKKMSARIHAINALEPKYQALSDEELKAQTGKFKRRLAEGETVDDLLVEAFAVCREAGQRFLNMRHYDVQLIGGMILHGGAIAEMVTGEGKTLVSTLPAYLNALAGSVHVVTVNDYLARRDMEWMGPLHMGLGLTVSAIQSGMEPDVRQKAYACDITYGTNNEFGFDYLRDNMRTAARDDQHFPKRQQQCQGDLNYAIIDEVDNILIDEARTPLIISGQAHADIRRYSEADQIASQLKKEEHFIASEKDHSAHLTDVGVREAEKLAGVESFYTAGNMEWPHLIDNALKAHHLYKRDVSYVVKEGTVIIVDEFTGRLMEGRQWSDGLHQAVEAKEGVRIKEETQTLATITLQNFFKLYNKLSGMTGTAMTEASEFWKIYELDVVAVPTNRPLQRAEHADMIYRSEKEKYAAMANEIEQLHRWDTVLLTDERELCGEITSETDESVQFKQHGQKNSTEILRSTIKHLQKKGRPILVGTVSIEKSERLGSLLSKRGVKHEVLNAKQHKREADIVAQAGRFGAVTIATNMAGRGTDIVLGGNPETMAWAQLQHQYETRLDVPSNEWEQLVKEIRLGEKMESEGELICELGGLHIIGTERHEARRIDLQLRGRSGRQGDPGSSRFYLSLEDDLMRIFAGEWVRTWLTRLGMKDGQAIESKMVSKRIEGAQKKVEERNFEIRKNLLEYDEVMDEQRKRVYEYRQNILDGANCKELILEMIAVQVEQQLTEFLDQDFGTESFASWAGGRLNVELDNRDFRDMDFTAAEAFAKYQAERMAEAQVLDLIEENLPADEESREWNWSALAKIANTRWQLSHRDRDLKKIGRDNLDEYLIEKARAAIGKVDLSDGAHYLEKDFGLRMALEWVQYKFGFQLEINDYRDLDPQSLKDHVLEAATKMYEQREIEFPVMAGLIHFTTRDGSGGRRYDRQQLVGWARDRFKVELDLADLRSKQRDEIRDLLIAQSRCDYELGQQTETELSQRLESFQAAEAAETETSTAIEELSQWCQEKLGSDLDAESWGKLEVTERERTLMAALHQRFCPEIRRMERSLTLQILDAAWKDHLLAMDHLRSSVGLRGYAQVDPKVEYKREGMRIFEAMWHSIQERVTDLIFRMEQLDDEFVSSTWIETAATHDDAQSAVAAANEQMEMSGEEVGSSERIEPIRNRDKRIGRNAPCPCGSGKKYKNCCMRSGSSAQQPVQSG